MLCKGDALGTEWCRALGGVLPYPEAGEGCWLCEAKRGTIGALLLCIGGGGGGELSSVC